MSQSTIRSVQHDIMQELKFFIAGATKKIKPTQLEITKTAVSLLKTLPACREAILEYFCTVFDNATSNHIEKVEAASSAKMSSANDEDDDDESILSEIHTTVCSLIANRAESWAPIISTWSLELLGELSTKYSGRAHVSSSVNEELQYWMNCRATRTLIDITAQCLSSLIHSDTEACINALLDTSVKHSPNFDWVVAHVGSCFPTTVITRVLSCGLKDFCQNKSYEQGCDSPKLKSVVGILGHLAGSHGNDIFNALLDLFNSSLFACDMREGDDKVQQKATVPFLLQLAFLSPTLLTTICREIKNILTFEIIIKLYYSIDDWNKYFGSPEALKMFIVNLILKVQIGGIPIINILLDCIFSNELPTTDVAVHNAIKSTAREILDYVLLELDTQVRLHSQNNSQPVYLVESFQCEIEYIHEMLLSAEKLKAQTAATLITFIGHNSPSVLIKSAAFLFVNANSTYHLSLLLQILLSELIDKGKESYREKGGYFAVVLEEVLNKLEESKVEGKQHVIVNVWMNLLILLKWEKEDREPLLKCKLIARAMHSNMTLINNLFVHANTPVESSHVIANLLDILEVPSPNGYLSFLISTESVLILTNNTVNYFFLCCRETNKVRKIKGLKRACDIFARLSLYLKAAKTMALKDLLERALFTNDNIFFGGKVKRVTRSESEKLLLEQNRNNRKIISVSKNVSAVNGGIIGNGMRSEHGDAENLPLELITENTEELLKAIKACCIPTEQSKHLDVSLESVTSVSLLLVQLISPDVMYNGLPWPDEDFCKVTIERDFYIRRLFNGNPLLWDLLAFVAVYRPTLCYCSVLLRALTATLIHQWNSMGDAASNDKYKETLETTIKVLDVMSLGQLLPPPLSEVRNIVGFLKPYEILMILRECIWNYMRDHVPSPALYNVEASGIHWRDPILSRPPHTYTKTLRIIMAHNIQNVGHLYHNMFVNIPNTE